MARPILPTRRRAPAWLQPTGTDAVSGTGGTAAYRNGEVVSAKPAFFAGAIFGSVARQRPADESGAQPSEPANGENGDRMPNGAQATGEEKAKAHARIGWMRWCVTVCWEQDDEAVDGGCGNEPWERRSCGEAARTFKSV